MSVVPYYGGRGEGEKGRGEREDETNGRNGLTVIIYTTKTQRFSTLIWESGHFKVFPTLMGADTCPIGPCHMLLGGKRRKWLSYRNFLEIPIR